MKWSGEDGVFIEDKGVICHFFAKKSIQIKVYPLGVLAKKKIYK